MSGLTRKKIKVRGKSGKTFQRSVMVRAEAIGKRTKGKKLNSLNPWQMHHVEHVNTNTKLGERQKAYGSSGPGSDHSWFAHLVGIEKQQYQFQSDTHTEAYSGTGQHANLRRRHAVDTADRVSRFNATGHAIAQELDSSARNSYGRNFDSRELIHSVKQRYGRDNIHEVHQDPRKWVR
jgi:hypothetical protein